MNDKLPVRFPLRLFAAIMQQTPAQPATNLWRAAELTAVADYALPLLRDCRAALDLGCGDGGVMSALKPHLSPATEITGLDPDPCETELARECGVYSGVVTSGAESMPAAGESFDAIISNSVLEHIEPIEKVLAECFRVLRPGGWFVATVPGPDFHLCLGGPWLPWAARADYERELDQRLAHCRYWTAEEWRQRLSNAGLALTSAHDYLPVAVVRRWELLSRLTGGLLYSLAGKKAPPICLQRRLGLRRRKIPFCLAYAAAWILSRGLDGDKRGPYGGLLLIGRKEP